MIERMVEWIKKNQWINEWMKKSIGKPIYEKKEKEKDEKEEKRRKRKSKSKSKSKSKESSDQLRAKQKNFQKQTRIDQHWEKKKENKARKIKKGL